MHFHKYAGSSAQHPTAMETIFDKRMDETSHLPEGAFGPYNNPPPFVIYRLSELTDSFWQPRVLTPLHFIGGDSTIILFQ